MAELLGVLAAVLSSAIGGTSIAATRFAVASADPLTLGAFRFGLGFAFLMPVACVAGGRWPPARDSAAIVGLGFLFFALFPILFNASLLFTTAARGALALSTLPLLTMLVAALLGAEALTLRKTSGVLVATVGVSIALAFGLSGAPSGAWRGDLLMVGAAFCMALYNVWSKPFIARSDPLSFTSLAMVSGAIVLCGVSAARGGFRAVADFQTAQWLAVLYLGAFGGALTFFLWAYALKHTTPTRVAVSVTVNPIAASALAALILHEPITANVMVGLVAVLAGIALATTGASRTSTPPPREPFGRDQSGS